MSDQSVHESRPARAGDDGAGWWVAVLIAAAAMLGVAMLVSVYSV